jgi:hypothetical protein
MELGELPHRNHCGAVPASPNPVARTIHIDGSVDLPHSGESDRFERRSLEELGRSDQSLVVQGNLPKSFDEAHDMFAQSRLADIGRASLLGARPTLSQVQVDPHSSSCRPFGVVDGSLNR